MCSSDLLSKPVSPEQLEAALRRWVPDPGAAVTDAPRPQGWVPRASGPVDWNVLSELLAMTRPDFLQDLLNLFLRDSRKMINEMQEARAGGDLTLLKQVAHKMRGSCATVGARRMMAITTTIDECPDAELRNRAAELLADLEEEFGAVRQALRTEKRRAGAPFRLEDAS